MINSRISAPLIKCTRIRISALTFHTLLILPPELTVSRQN